MYHSETIIQYHSKTFIQYHTNTHTLSPTHSAHTHLYYMDTPAHTHTEPLKLSRDMRDSTL